MDDIFEINGLHMGRMIAGSKSGYRKRHEGHDILFNANIFIPSEHKIWWGDLNITLDAIALQNCCNYLNEEMIVVSEMYGRFGAEERKYKEIEKNAHIKFIPNEHHYLRRTYTEGFDITKIGNMFLASGKRDKWERMPLPQITSLN